MEDENVASAPQTQEIAPSIVPIVGMRPIITMNGDTRRELVAQRFAAMRAIRSAMTALEELCPNGRNYIGNAERFTTDRAIHAARFATLDQLHNELQDEALAIHTPGVAA